MKTLAGIDREQAERLLRETDYANRMIGVSMNASAGNTRRSLYSFEEVARFIYADSTDKLFQKGQSAITYIEMDKLVNWIRHVYKDDELADVLEKELKEAPNQIDQLIVVSKRMQERLKQCYEILNEDKDEEVKV